jgi:type II secretory pathway component PulC
MKQQRKRAVLLPALPGAACLGLALLIHDELMNPPAPPASQGPQAEAAAVEPLPREPALTLAPLEDFSEIVERPVFSRTRRPDEVPAQPTSEPVKSVPQFSLAGTVITELGRVALAVTESDGSPVRVAEGRPIDGWTAARIESDRVLFRRGESEHLMILEFYSPSEQVLAPEAVTRRAARDRSGQTTRERRADR